MGVEATDEQVDYLFKIQQELGIEISLTINQLNIPVEIFYSKNDRVLGSFLEWLQYYYERGLRSCTLANNHMMRAGFLQKKFPEMKWKNTVNQQVSTAQQVLDCLYLGYNIIQLDRSLNRNFEELKRIKQVVENFKNKHPENHIKTCMLVWEGCLPSCPFKMEHDSLQIFSNYVDYWYSLGRMTCRKWRDAHNNPELSIMPRYRIPRSSINCFWLSADTFKEYAELVDIFKYSGRLTSAAPLHKAENYQLAWIFAEQAALSSFSEIIENKMEPIHLWFPGWATDTFSSEMAKEFNQEYLKKYSFKLNDLKKLEQRLKNCKSQCYSCHLCERVFGIPDIDSMLEI